MLKTAMISAALVGVLLLASPAWAAPAPGEATSDQPDYIDPVTGDVSGDVTIDATDTEDAISRVPTYEETLDGRYEETPQEAFLRLAEDYLWTSEIGSRTIGRVPVWPRGAVKLGPLELFPYLTGSISWTNNLYEEDGGDSSAFFTLGGGFTGEHMFDQEFSRIAYGIDFRYRWYTEDSENDAEVVVGVGYRRSFRSGFWISLGIKWEHLVDPIQIEDTGDLERDIIYPHFDLGWDEVFGSQINVEVGVDYTHSAYDEREFDTGDYGEWNAHLKISYPFLYDTTRIYVRYDYHYARRDSERLNDLDHGHELSGGIEGLIPLTESGRLTGFLEFGYRQDAYDSAELYTVGTDTLSTDSDDSKGIVDVGIGLNYYMGARTVWTFHALRTLQHSTRGNYQATDRVDLAVQRVLMRELVGRLTLYWERSDPSSGVTVGGDTITRYGAGAGLSWLLLDNLDIFLDGEVTDRSTDREGYDETIFTATLGVNFNFN